MIGMFMGCGVYGFVKGMLSVVACIRCWRQLNG